jgi:hypothetical membrane protein
MINYYVLLVFAPILLLTGIVDFFIPQTKSPASVAPAYNVFHIIFGLIGIALVFWRDESCIRTFNIGFGLIDLYQIAANRFDLFRKKYFRWRTADDVLHIIIGIGLVLVGVFAS